MKWEYRVEQVFIDTTNSEDKISQDKKSMSDLLNRLGWADWELTGVIPIALDEGGTYAVRLLFKRI